MLDLADPAWEGRVGIAAGGADFQAIVSAVLELEGEDATREWLTGLEQNAEIYSSNTAVMKAVDEGEVPVGITYHYYWYRDQAQNGLIGDDAELHYFGNQDPGAFVSVSGAGVLASSDQPEDAQRLVEYLTSPEAPGAAGREQRARVRRRHRRRLGRRAAAAGRARRPGRRPRRRSTPRRSPSSCRKWACSDHPDARDPGPGTTASPAARGSRASGRRGCGARRSPLALAVGVAALALLPLGYIVSSTIDVGWAGVQELVFRPRVAELLWNTTRLALGTVVVCGVLGVGAAWLVERSSVPFRRVWHVLLVAPLAVPAFVNSYAWISLLPGFDTYGGALLVVSLSYFPFVYLPVAAAFRGLDPALEETARGLGLSSWAVFRRVQLPQLRVALLGGSLLVALHLLAEFGALQMLRYPTFTTAIYDQYRATFNGPGATMLAGVLVLLCLVLLLAEIRLRGRRGYARTGRGASRPPRPVGARPADRARTGRPGRRRRPRPRRAARQPRLLDGRRRLDRLRRGGPGRHHRRRRWPWPPPPRPPPPPWRCPPAGSPSAPGAGCPTLLERATYLGSSVPGIVVALALVTLSIRATPWLYQTVPVLLAAYAILFLPRAIVTVRAAVEQSPRLYDDVAASLGSSAAGPAAPGDPAAARAGHRRRRRAGLPGGGHRADRDPAARPHRNDDAGDGVLVGEQRPGVRGGRPVRGGHGAAQSHRLPCCCPATSDEV